MSKKIKLLFLGITMNCAGTEKAFLVGQGATLTTADLTLRCCSPRRAGRFMTRFRKR